MTNQSSSRCLKEHRSQRGDPPGLSRHRERSAAISLLVGREIAPVAGARKQSQRRILRLLLVILSANEGSFPFFCEMLRLRLSRQALVIAKHEANFPHIGRSPRCARDDESNDQAAFLLVGREIASVAGARKQLQ